MNNQEAIVEGIYYTYNKKGKEIQKFIEEKLEQRNAEISKTMEENGWDIWDYVHAIQGSKPCNKLTEQDIQENLQVLDPYEKSVVE